jgi:alanine-glyoxylate transaminase/serine-glyoxylate transaminase/serine-pyruvate transaminase
VSHAAGRHFLQIPGPTNCPLVVLAAIAQPVIDHRGPEFRALALDVLAGLQRIFKTKGPVLVFPASGTAAWEAAIVNTLSPGDHVLMYETGWFATLWSRLAKKFGLEAEYMPGDWRSGVDVARIEARLAADKSHTVKAVCIVHNETSTGTLSNVLAVRQAMDRTRHPALLMVDTVSSLAATDYRHDEWGVDVTICGSQKGLMLPPGLGFNAVSAKARAAAKAAKLPRAFWDWEEMIAINEKGFFPSTPGTNLLQGLRVAIAMLEDEGLDTVFARHARAAEATRRAVQHWGLELQCQKATDHSPAVTTIRMPEGHSADKFRAEVLKRYNMSLGSGLGPLADKVFRIGHLGDFNALQIAGTLAGVQMGLAVTGVPHKSGGVEAALGYLQGNAGPGLG